MITIEVAAYKDSIPIESLCHQRTDHAWPKQKDIMADNPRVRIEVGETVGGPRFSSIRVHVSIETPYNPDSHKVDEMANLLYDKALELLDSFIPPTYNGLIAHLKTLRPEED